MPSVEHLAYLLQRAQQADRAVERQQYSCSSCAQIEMSTFTGNHERQARWLLQRIEALPE